MVPGTRNKFVAPGSKRTALKKVLATLLGLYGARSDSAPRDIVTPSSLGTPLATGYADQIKNNRGSPKR